MKKLLTAILGAAMLFAAAGSAFAAGKVIGLALASDTNPFYIAMRKGVTIRAKQLGWKVRIVVANEDVNKQVNGVQDLVAQKVDGILISPIDRIATGAAYEAAHKAKIPIISIARGAKSKYQTLHVAMDEVRIGKDIAAWIAKKTGGRGKVAMIAGPAGSGTFRNLANGFQNEIKKNPCMRVVFKRTVPLTREEGLKQTEDILVSHPDVRAIYGANDELALGAAQVVGATGKKGGIIITGMNGVPPALAAVAKGRMDMTVVLNPVAWGILGVNVMDRYLKGERPKQKVFIKHVLATKSNALKYIPPKRKIK